MSKKRVMYGGVADWTVANKEMYEHLSKTVVSINFFEIGAGSELDWIVAADMKSAREWLKRESGNTKSRTKQLSNDVLDDYYITDIYSPESEAEKGYNEEDYFRGYKIIESFADYGRRLKNSCPHLIASTKE